MKAKNIVWIEKSYGFAGSIDANVICQIEKEYGVYRIYQMITGLIDQRIHGVSFDNIENAKDYFKKTVMNEIHGLFFEEEK